MSSDKIDIYALKFQIGADELYALPRDVSPREYFRGVKDGQKIILMLYPQANDANRAELLEFIRIGKWLNSNGIKSPELIEKNNEKCFALFEDLGDVSFGKALHQNILNPNDLYTMATDVLCVLRDAKPLTLPSYRDGRVHENRRQLIDYYVTFLLGARQDEAMVQDFLAVWDGIEAELPPCSQGFVHGDFHLENVIYRPDERGVNRCGVIDFQDALYGPLPYDLVNLLEDARVSVAHDIKVDMIARYCANMSAGEQRVFRSWYRVLAAQFHGRVLGLFIKLAAEQGRDSYLIHIERLQNYMMESLNDPLLAPLKAWFKKEGVDFAPIKDLHGDRIRACFKGL